MQAVKDSFMASVNKSKNRADMEGFSTKTAPESGKVVAIPRKRDEEDSDEELVQLAKKKQKSQKRSKHWALIN